jgi:hypothetical protein
LPTTTAHEQICLILPFSSKCLNYLRDALLRKQWPVLKQRVGVSVMDAFNADSF